ncbi:IS66 family insertion sequence element accessory protein TnpB [Burkholderia cenocepacia]
MRGQVFVFKGRRGDSLKVLYWSDGGLCLLANYLASYYNSFG